MVRHEDIDGCMRKERPCYFQKRKLVDYISDDDDNDLSFTKNLKQTKKRSKQYL